MGAAEEWQRISVLEPLQQGGGYPLQRAPCVVPVAVAVDAAEESLAGADWRHSQAESTTRVPSLVLGPLRVPA